MSSKAERQAKSIIYAIARVEPVGTSVELEHVDRARIREQFAEAVGEVLGLDLETIDTWLDVGRMVAE